MKSSIIVLLIITWSNAVLADPLDPGSTDEKNLAAGEELQIAAENANNDALARQCATEKNPSPGLQALCAQLDGSLDKLKAAAFTGCALVTETVARLLIEEGKSKDAIDYYQKATNDYLAGARKLVTREEFKAILDEESGKLRAGAAGAGANRPESILHRARQCAKALDEVSSL